VAHTCKYDLTTLASRVLVTALLIREYFVQPTLVILLDVWPRTYNTPQSPGAEIFPESSP
jgi:hypothetical protein